MHYREIVNPGHLCYMLQILPSHFRKVFFSHFFCSGKQKQRDQMLACLTTQNQMVTSPQHLGLSTPGHQTTVSFCYYKTESFQIQ